MSLSMDLMERARKVIPGGVNSSVRKIEPCFGWKTAKGAYLWDMDGNKYVDLNAAWAACILGHRYDEVDNAVIDAIKDCDLIGLGTTEYEVALAEKIVENFPCADRALFSTCGSEATYHAIRLSRAATGRNKIIKFQGGYHGWHDFVLRNLYNKEELMYTRDLGSKGMLDSAVDETIICRFNDLEDVEAKIKAYPDQIAAIITEPVAHNLGCVQLQNEFLKGLRKLCDENGILLIFDEVITGLRVGMHGYQGICGVTPDLCTIGKAIGNTYPIAIVAGKAKYMDMFNTAPNGNVAYGGTFNGGPFVMAACLKTMEILERDKVHDYLFDLGDYLRSGMNKIFEQQGYEAEMTGYGSIAIPLFAKGPFTCQDDIMRSDMAKVVEFRKGLVKRGYYLVPGDVKRLCLMYSHTKEDIDGLFQAAEDTLKEMKK
ncbi:MAG: aspartate aminotransferase family protein [Ruminococcaceae bacterium]|nr:aspartate aminotransferase family protein [Oscillospiraceae bacterium]